MTQQPTTNPLSTYTYRTPIKVRFAETDANGHMSHVSVVIYMEQARCDFLTALGLFDPEEMRRTQKTFVLAAQSINYKNQAYYNDPLTIESYVSRLGSSSLDIDYRILHTETGTLVATGTSTIVHFDLTAQKSTPLPSDLPHRIATLTQ